MNLFAFRRIAAACLLSAMVLSGPAFGEASEDCTGGRPDPGQCVLQRKKADAELLELNKALLQKKAASGHSGLAAALGRSHRAWLAYRDAQCGLEHLVDGTSDAYRPAMVEACRLDMTRQRVQDIRRQTGL